MPYCLRCGYEYREGITACADCHEALVDKPPARQSRPVELVLIFSGRSMESRMLVEALRQHTIPSMTRAAEPMRGIIGDAALPFFEEVYVSRADLESRVDEVEQCLNFVRQGEG